MADRSPEEIAVLWDKNAAKMAANISRLGDRNKEVLLTPRVLDWLGDVKDKKILDAGCGEGFLCRLIAEHGAQVTGIDFSSKLLEIARNRTPKHLLIRYIHANLEKILEIQSDSFDRIVSLLALQDIQDYRAALQELYRVLRPEGQFFLAITHPCFGSDGEWIRDERGKKLYWKTDRYFQEREIEMRIDPDSDENPIGFHRTLSSYYQEIKRAGFMISDLIEPSPSPKAIKTQPSFEDDLRMCHFIVFDLRKD
jgi:ubiquinone/menaquinone biosynthesis C-methylase UbiE